VAKLLVQLLQIDRRLALLKRLLQIALPAVLRALFIIYPQVTNVAFEAFSCYEFVQDRFSALIADVSITCTTGGVLRDGVPSNDWRRVITLAWTAVVLYPIGLIIVNGVLLFCSRDAILHRKPSPLSIAIAFLHKEYEPWACWWELMVPDNDRTSPPVFPRSPSIPSPPWSAGDDSSSSARRNYGHCFSR
jgi:hypothetical protein